MMIKRISQGLLLSMLLLTVSFAQERTNPATQWKELGTVSWYRDYDQAAALALEQQKDILILFQEVPGCATCRNYGHNVLSHPLMVEAIKDQFIPLAIYNNAGGKDKVVLERFGEPSWNNPVVRIVDSKGNNLIDRIAGNYSAKALATGMQQALRVQQKPVPAYLSLLVAELGLGKKSNLKEHYYLKRSTYQYLPLTQAQKTKINSALGKGESAEQYLSPQQKTWLAEIHISEKAKKQVLAFSDFIEAWRKREAY